MTSLRQLYEIYPPEPRATMPFGVRVDDLVFGSVTATDPLTGVAEGDMEAQLAMSMSLIEHLLTRGGMSWTDVDSVEAYASEASTGELASLLERELGPLTGIPRFFAQPAVLRAGQRLRLDIVALRGGSRPEIRHLRLAAGVAPVAARIGSLLFAYDVSPIDARTGRIEYADTASQVATAFDNLDRVLEAASMERNHLLRIAGFFSDLDEKDVLNNRMVVTFPDASQKPVHKYVPASLMPGAAFGLQALGLVSDDRRIIEMEGVRHNDPISLGAIAGNVFVSSRVQAQLEPSARQQTARLVDGHARRLLEHMGGSLEDVSQMVWGIGDASYAQDVCAECARYWPGDSMPQLEVLHADFPNSPLPRLEFTALLSE